MVLKSIAVLTVMAAFLAYGVSFVTLWVYVESIRRETRASALPSGGSMFWGVAALTYLWSDNHRDAKDERLSRRVIAVRIIQVVLLVAAVAPFILQRT